MTALVAYCVYGIFAAYAAALVIALAAPKRITAAQIMLMLGAMSGIASAAATFAALTHGTAAVMLLLGLLRLDMLSAFFLLLISTGVLFTAFFAIGYVPRHAHAYSLRELQAASAFFVSGMTFVILANAPALFLLAWEMMSVAAYLLIIADRTEESYKAGFLYFVITQIGFFALVSGFLLLARGALFGSWQSVAVVASGTGPSTMFAAFTLLFVGFGSKAGLVPLHQWLPYAHPQAPSHISALLSGSMLSVALFGFVQALPLFPVIALSWAAVVIAVGLVSALFGALHAAVETDGKRLLAWSSVENMGLLFAGVGLYLALAALPADPTFAVLRSGVQIFIALHTLNHFLFKTGLFMALGAIVSRTHTRSLDEMGGLARAWPRFSFWFLLLSLAGAALPPLGAFFGEWILLQTLSVSIAVLPPLIAICAGVVLTAVGLVAGLAVFANIKLFSAIFLGRPRTEHAEKVGTLPYALTLPVAATALLSLISGLATAFVSALSGAPIGEWFTLHIAAGAQLNGFVVCGLLCGALVIAALVRRLGSGVIHRTRTWDCGTPLTPRMQYSATGFAAPIRFFFRAFLVTHKALVAVPISEGNRWIVNQRLEWSVRSVWEHWVYVRIGSGVLAIAAQVRRLQNGVVQAYLLLVLITLITTIALSV